MFFCKKSFLALEHLRDPADPKGVRWVYEEEKANGLLVKAGALKPPF
jgi:hypothetical protein